LLGTFRVPKVAHFLLQIQGWLGSVWSSYAQNEAEAICRGNVGAAAGLIGGGPIEFHADLSVRDLLQ
jgi:hypothetical protein